MVVERKKVADRGTRSPTAKYSIPITDADMAGVPASNFVLSALARLIRSWGYSVGL